MARHILMGLLVTLVPLLTACSDKEPESKTDHRELYKGVNAPLEKAQRVDSEIQSGAAQRSQEIDRQTEDQGASE